MEHTLTPEEKRFILIVERGDTAGAAQVRIPTLLAYCTLTTFPRTLNFNNLATKITPWGTLLAIERSQALMELFLDANRQTSLG